MIDTRRITALLTTLIRRLETFDTSSAERLNLLVAAIEDEDTADISAWADADLYQLLPPTQILDQYHAHLVRNTPGSRSEQRWSGPLQIILVLLPVIITILSLARALMLYPHFLLAHTRSGASSLLYGWQQGFDGQLPIWLSPSNILLYDLFLVLVCTGFFFWRIRWSNRASQRAQQIITQQQQALRADLVEVLALTTLYLAHYKNKLLVADNLTLIARRIDEMSRRLEDRFEQSVDKFDGMAQNVTQRFDGMTQNMSGKFTGMTQNVTESFDGMTQNVTENFSGMAQNLSDKFDGMTQNVARNLASMNRGAEKNLEGMIQQVSESFAGMTREVAHEFEGTTRDVTTRYDGMSQQIMKRISQITDRMQEQVLDGNKYLKELGNLTTGVVQTAEQVREAARTLKETNSELALHTGNLVTPVVELAQQQEHLIASTDRSIQLLEDATQTMADLSKKQDRWGTDLRNILDTLDLTIERATELYRQP
ncbi:hypothetical protein KDW_18710 [Dictyobacter vulcani]|uniref:Uncharacterized protein n=1 Tax=Dictyobacter vulcani TaxID=2607529 RepID=A0A5J4KNM9_9CHLR|nr:hypothetical protein [Dictyobacter vulcani]GER87709.1 hypothetical protein KDW_18710 [Dictyobacter vulcani]